MSDDREARYARHLMLPEFGRKGQAALEQSKVACIGAGGLGSSALLYLAAAGIGTIRIIDDDDVEPPLPILRDPWWRVDNLMNVFFLLCPSPQ